MSTDGGSVDRRVEIEMKQEIVEQPNPAVYCRDWNFWHFLLNKIYFTAGE